MSNVFDVGQLVTELVPSVEKMKLYKLCFFSQGWHLAWTGRPLFEEKLLACAEGPVPARLRREADAVVRGWEIPNVPGETRINFLPMNGRWCSMLSAPMAGCPLERCLK